MFSRKSNVNLTDHLSVIFSINCVILQHIKKCKISKALYMVCPSSHSIQNTNFAFNEAYVIRFFFLSYFI